MNQKELETILRYIDGHIEERLRLTDLADLAGYSPFYFSKLFSEAMGMPVTGYIRVRKLQYALASLMEGKKVLEVAAQYSFESHEGFARAFKQLFGSAPRTVKRFLQSYQVPDYVVPETKGREEAMEKQNLKETMCELLWEVLRQSLAEAKEGYATEIQLELLPEQQVRVADNGRGIPLAPNKENTAILDNILAGKPITSLEYSRMGDFGNLGMQTVNSLCESLHVNVWRDSIKYSQDYVRGIAQHEVMVSAAEHQRGMEIIFKPDGAIFGGLEFDREVIKTWIKEKPNIVLV